MKKLEWSVVAALLLVVVGIPLFQSAYEVFEEKEIPFVFNLFTHKPTKANLHRWDQNAKDRSVVAQQLRPVTFQLRYDLLGEVAPKSIQGLEHWLFYYEDVDYLLQPPYLNQRFYKGSLDTLVAGNWVNTRNPIVAIMDFRDQLKKIGVELLVVPIPGKPSVYPEMLVRGMNDIPPSPTLKFLEDLRRRGVHVADLFTPMLAAKAAGSSTLYLKRDTHWSPQGMEVAAEALASRIRQLIPDFDTVAALGPQDSSSFIPRYIIKDTTFERWGDIAEMTKVPNRREMWSTDTVTATQIWETQTGMQYKDDPSANILWLGDSYSRIYQTDAPGSAGVIAHVAYKLNQPLASLVNDGGASTLVRQKLARQGNLLQGKKWVVWTFVERDIRFGASGWQLLGGL